MDCWTLAEVCALLNATLQFMALRGSTLDIITTTLGTGEPGMRNSDKPGRTYIVRQSRRGAKKLWNTLLAIKEGRHLRGALVQGRAIMQCRQRDVTPSTVSDGRATLRINELS